jgi:hypothetical protein
VSGSTGDITVTRANFSTRRQRLTISGRGPGGAGLTVIGPNGQIGGADFIRVNPRGSWRASATTNLPPGATLTIFSGTGSVVTGVPVTVR